MQLTQAELAEKINYSDKSISKWERGEGVPDIIILKQLADFYGITVSPVKLFKQFNRNDDSGFHISIYKFYHEGFSRICVHKTKQSACSGFCFPVFL